jgi:hypothetical protein
MSGLLRRLKRRRPATADENVSPTAASSEPAAAPSETPAEAGGKPPVPGEQPTVVLPATTNQPLPAWTIAAHPATTAQPVAADQPAGTTQALPAWTIAASQPTAFAAQPAQARDLPAGVDPGDLAGAPPASARRGKLRRRLRYLRHVRELLLRDLGGFTYEVHRTAGGTAQEPQRRLAAAKAERISALDAEVLALEMRLGEPHAGTVLREPGIGGTCPECGELHASDAHFCARCGAPLDDKARAQRAAEQPPATGSHAVVEQPPTTGSHAVVEPQPASVLWAGGPRPAPAGDEEETAPEPLSEVTSEWLAGDRPTTFARAAQPDAPAEADEPKPGEPKADKAKPGEPAADEPSAPPGPATAAARAKPTRVSKPRKPAKRAPAKPRATAPEPQADAPEPQADVPKPEADAPEPQADAPEPPERAADSDPPQTERGDFQANGQRDDDVPPPLSPGDPLAAPRERGS